MTRRRATELVDIKSDIGPYVITPVWLLDKLASGDVTFIDLAVFNVLAKYADWQTREAWPSKQLLAKDLGLRSTSTIYKSLSSLKAIGAIDILADFHENGSQATNRYIVHFANPDGVATTTTPPVRDDAPPHASGRTPPSATASAPHARRRKAPMRGDGSLYKEELDPVERDPSERSSSADADVCADDLAAVFGPPPLTIAWVQARWNEVCATAGCVAATVESPRLIKATSARLKEHRDVSWWEDFFARVAASDFLTGHAEGRDFRADLRWFMCSVENIAKLFEGRYTNNLNVKAPRPPAQPANRAPAYSAEEKAAAEQRQLERDRQAKIRRERELEAAEAIAAMADDVRDALAEEAARHFDIVSFRHTMLPDAYRTAVHQAMVSLLCEGAGRGPIAAAAATFTDRIVASRRATA
jgi:hypothetical protein